MDDHDLLTLLAEQAEQANALLSNAMKYERERWVCQRLLHALNVSQRLEDFQPSSQEPPDVLVAGANFEVFFVLDEGRRLNEEWRQELDRRRSAFSVQQLVPRELRRIRLKPAQLLRRLEPTATKKALSYRERGIAPEHLDLLAFTSLKHADLDANADFPPPTTLMAQGWRSVSVVGPRFARVLFAGDQAPAFLRHNRGRTILMDVGLSL